MNNQGFHKLTRFAAALFAVFALSALTCAQATSKITNTAKKVAAARNTVTQLAQPVVVQAPVQADAGQAPATANVPVQPIQPIASNTPVSATSADPTSQVQNGINQVNEKKQKAKSIWNQIKTIKK